MDSESRTSSKSSKSSKSFRTAKGHRSSPKTAVPPEPGRAAKPPKAAGPVASRPSLPKEYGFATSPKGLLPWSHVVDRMTQARHYWVATVDPEGRPHATPVDGLWIDDRLYFGGSPQTRRNRNLRGNAATCVHLENAMDVVILHGETETVHPDRSTAESLAEAINEKYGFGMPAESYEKSGVQVFRPKTVFAWKDFAKDATRWRL